MDHGYLGNEELRTPGIDLLADQSVNFTHAISGLAASGPHRASLLTGQYPLTHGFILDDLRLSEQANTFAKALTAAGYDTAYIGKWHLDGGGHASAIPPERRHGFAYWKALENTHNYDNSKYYAQDGADPLTWDGYDAYAQTADAVAYLKGRVPPGTSGGDAPSKPFALFLSWGPPHPPYRTGPTKWLDRYDSRRLPLRANVPPHLGKEAEKNYAGYYAHCSALDECVGSLVAALKDSAQLANTIIVYTSDHGDMLHSRGQLGSLRPWDESIRVPFLVRCPEPMQVAPRTIGAPLNTPDIMPTLLALAGIPVPATVEGEDLSGVIRGTRELADNHALLTCPSPFGQWPRSDGGREFRGVRTSRHTYTRGLDGPWELFDNQEDPFQQHNLVADPAHQALRDDLQDKLAALLERTGDDFAPGPELLRRCGYRVDESGSIDYRDPNAWGQLTRTARADA